jgi:hypothetical protein
MVLIGAVEDLKLGVRAWDQDEKGVGNAGRRRFGGVRIERGPGPGSSYGLDPERHDTFTRIVNSKVHLIDRTRQGTPRQEQPGRSFDIDSIADYVVGTIPEPAFPFTMACWARVTDATTGNQHLMSVSDSSATDVYQTVSIDADDIKVFRRDASVNTNATFSVTLSDATWHHIAVVFARLR